MERRKPGRPYLGPRKEAKVRLPDPLAAALAEEIKRRGVRQNDFLVQAVAEKLGFPLPGQHQLPLAEAS